MTAPTRTPGEVFIAGVPWPVYKIAAIVVFFVILAVVGVATASAGSAVVAAAASSAVVWLGLSLFHGSSAR